MSQPTPSGVIVALSRFPQTRVDVYPDATGWTVDDSGYVQVLANQTALAEYPNGQWQGVGLLAQKPDEWVLPVPGPAPDELQS